MLESLDRLHQLESFSQAVDDVLILLCATARSQSYASLTRFRAKPFAEIDELAKRLFFEIRQVSPELNRSQKRLYWF